MDVIKLFVENSRVNRESVKICFSRFSGSRNSEKIFFSWFQNKSISQSTYNEEILYGGSKIDILNLIKQNFSGIQTGVVIGHNPVLSELINDMAFKNKKILPSNLVTAGCIIFDYESSDYVNSNFKDGVVKEYIFPRQFMWIDYEFL